MAEPKDLKEPEFVEFGGMNCNDYLDEDQEPCRGWDIANKPYRCDCGNRRVYEDSEFGPTAD